MHISHKHIQKLPLYVYEMTKDLQFASTCSQLFDEQLFKELLERLFFSYPVPLPCHNCFIFIYFAISFKLFNCLRMMQYNSHQYNFS